jgi:acetyl esterase/lipase
MVSLSPAALAGPLRDWFAHRHTEQQQADVLDEDDASGHVTIPAGVRVLRDIPYGPDALQRMDIYLPPKANGAPVLFMVHGGGWRRGDKGAKAVVENKMTRWVAKGFIFVSANYRLLPGTAPLEQAQDVASALATAQRKATGWGGDPSKFMLMGHSAGAHLVALLSASPTMAFDLGARAWLGTVALDSAAFDVVRIMDNRHLRLYDQAFDDDRTYWKKVSPLHVLTARATPLLAVCSTRRADSCQQAHGFATAATSLGVRVTVLEQDLSHRDINQRLGVEGGYSDAVELFLGTLDESVRRRLATSGM